MNISDSVILKGGYEATNWTQDSAAHPTIIDADGANDSVVFIEPYHDVTIEGFTVQGANHTGEDSYGGIAIDRSAVVIRDTVVQNNQAEGPGGGIYIQDDGESASLMLIDSALLNNATSDAGGGLATSGNPTVTLENVEVRGNTATAEGGGLAAERITITNSRIADNTATEYDGGGIIAMNAYISHSEISGNSSEAEGASGGGIAVHNGVLRIESSVVEGNHGGGVTTGNSDTTIIDTRISGNEGDIAFAPWNSRFTLINCLIVDNEGIGIVGDEIPLTGVIMNTTIAGNGNRGTRFKAEEVHITNSILWGNGNTSECSGNCIVSYSDIEEGWPGPGNISTPPLLINPSHGNYHLRPISPAIDAGTNKGAPDHDLDGGPRPVDGDKDGKAITDMGAYEYMEHLIYLPALLH